MTGYDPGADASDELCPYLTESGAVGPSSPAESADDLCPHLTEADTDGTDSQPPFVRARHAEGALPGSPAGPRAIRATAAPWVRPYVLTGGRTRAHHELLVHTLVSVPDYRPSVAVQLPPEARSLYERAHAHTESVAELSAHCGIPLGVTRVLLSDLTAAGHMTVGPDPYPSPYDSELLERIIDGLQQFV
jgi:hypothetical protein